MEEDEDPNAGGKRAFIQNNKTNKQKLPRRGKTNWLAGQGWTGQDKAGQGWTRLDKAGQGWTRLDKAGQDKAGQDKAGQDKAGPDTDDI